MLENKISFICKIKKHIQTISWKF